MILSPMNVELTKVHYYESFRKHRNRITHPGAAEMCETIDNKININIKRNIFGQKSWTFNVQPKNEFKKPKNKSGKLLPVIVTSCVIFALILSAAIVTVIYMCNIHKHNQHNQQNNLKIPNNHNTSRILVFDHAEISVEKVLHKMNLHSQDGVSKTPHNDIKMTVCVCETNEVCLRQKDGLPKCVKGRDGRDPSGCSGLCAVNTEHCRLLDRKLMVYECVQNGGGLHCPLGYFNCADSLCLHVDNKCNGRVDCGDLSDEIDCACDLSLNFHCGKNTSCLPNWKRCDGKPDCWDNSDEHNCLPLNSCPTGQISCSNSTGCYHSSQFCDGVFDCTDKSDEICS
ncbi:atrial natriuretic peptide-converting enzyme-like [Atheta coriaria]|uniref:atrial natriuretic peptide-converting enzyme-like n=1 Tax=Dalotia coriaria TaxID=877792 RepID=UPI0031F3C254